MPSGYGSVKQPSVDPSRFAQVPRADVPRSKFNVTSAHKTTFDAGYLVPVYWDEVLPGDSFRLQMTVFTRMSTLIFPLMDNLFIDSFFFFVPNRLTWDNWEHFMGEQDNPGDSIDYTVPLVDWVNAGPAVGSIYDHFGIPTPIVTASTSWGHCALPFRAYNLIWNEWFRDQNLQSSVAVPTGDGPDATADYVLLRRGKRHDYFTSALPWAQKGSPVTVPFSGNAPVTGIGYVSSGSYQAGPVTAFETEGAVSYPYYSTNTVNTFLIHSSNITGLPEIYADLSTVSALTINTLRQSFAIQKLLERDARGGTRYTEILQAHFGVHPPDFRLQRPEYLGGGCSPVNVNPVAQTSETGTTPLGNLGGVGTGTARHGFQQSFTEHGFIIGLVAVRADLSYQQGLHRMWRRQTRYDFYWPEFSHLGEQTILQSEIMLLGTAFDNTVFGYQERYGEYRYKPSEITGMFRSGVAGTLDGWHLAQYYTTPPTLSSTFISDTPPVDRVVAAGDAANGQQFLFDGFFQCAKVRALPMYGVPGFIDKF